MFGPRARRYIANYGGQQAQLHEFATLAEETVRSALEHLHLELHLVAARVKSPASVNSKVRRKGYGDPTRQLTDAVGVRVITYYQDDVDRATLALRGTLEIDERRSVDKRHELQVRQFGYRSVHLIARFGAATKHPGHVQFRSRWFEIQVRSILEHAWAEIEHEVCYKSGIVYPEAFLRRFGALAGALEILEAQFLTLRQHRDLLIDCHRIAYQRDLELDVDLDAARLVAFLEANRPNGVGWRTAAHIGRPFAPGLESVCVEALRDAGIRTARQLQLALARSKCRRALQSFASLAKIGPEQVSHFALAVIAVGTSKRRALDEYPELQQDQQLMQAVFE